MSYHGPDFYDDPDVFDRYAQLRGKANSANDTLELPVLRQMLGDPTGHDVLDLGCGDGRFGQWLLAQGARSYTGLDGSKNMVAAARATLAGTAASVLECRLEDWDAAASRYTRVSSRLVLHYLEDLTPTLRAVQHTLKPGGLLVFSVEHPVITSCNEALQDSGLHQHWTVDDYFLAGRRVTHWMGADVVKYHRSVEDYFSAVQNAGLCVEQLRESRPAPESFSDAALLRRRQRIPLFLFIAARKPQG